MSEREREKRRGGRRRERERETAGGGGGGAPEGGWPTVSSRQEGKSSFLFFVSLDRMRKEKKE